MIKIEVKGNGIKRLQKATKAIAGPAAQKAYAVALNEVGQVAKNKTSRAVAKQMGIPGKTVIKRASITTRPAIAGRLSYVIKAEGGHTLLKDFKPAGSRKGVRAGPWARRIVFRGTFIAGKLHGNVFKRTTSDRFPIKPLYGPALPKEIVKDKAKETFETYVAQRLPKRIQHQLKRATNGAFD